MTDRERVGFLRSFLPGKKDGLFALVISLCVSVCCLAVIPQFHDGDPIPATAVLYGAIFLLLLATAHFNAWFIMSDRSIFARLLCAVGVSFALVFLFIGSIFWAASRVPSVDAGEVSWSYLVPLGLQRLGILGSVTVLGGIFKLFSRWRLILQTDQLDAKPTRQRLSIAIIMLITTVVAVVIAARNKISLLLDGKIDLGLGVMSGGRLSITDFVTRTVGIELVVTVAFLFVLWLSTWNRQARGNLPFFVAGMGLVCALGAFVFAVLLPVDAPPLMMLAIALLMWIVLSMATWMFSAYGFQFAHTTIDAHWSPIAPKLRRSGWLGWLVGCTLLVFVASSFLFTEVPALIAFGSWQQGVAFKRVSRELGVNYSPLEIEWEVREHKLGERIASVRFTSDDELIQARILGDSDPSAFVRHLASGEKPVYLSITSTGDIGARELQPITVVDELIGLHISGKSFDPDAMKDLCSQVPIRHLRVTVPGGFSDDQILALDSDSLSGVWLISQSQPVVLNAVTEPVLRKKKMSDLSVRYADPLIPHFDSIEGLRSLHISDSKVDGRILSQLQSIKLTNLSFADCEFDRPTLAALSKVPTHSLYLRSTTNHPQKKDLLLLADCPSYSKLTIHHPSLDEFFEIKLRRLISDSSTTEDKPEVEVADNATGNVRTHPFAIVRRREGSVEAALKSIANEVKADDQGAIVELDISGLPLDPDLARSIASLQSLRRLRLSNDNAISGGGYGSCLLYTSDAADE